MSSAMVRLLYGVTTLEVRLLFVAVKYIINNKCIKGEEDE